MARYIDAEKIELAWYVPDVGYLTDYQKKHNELSTYAQAVIDSAPTADVAPVKHAHWIEDGDDYICSNCNEIVFPCISGLQMDKSLKEGKTYWNYCPHCGAKMEEQCN